MIWIFVGNQIKSYGYSCEAPAATRSCCRSACARRTSPPAPPASPPRWSSGSDRCTLWSRPTPASYKARRSPSPCKASGWSTHSFGLNSKSDVTSLILNDTYGHTGEVLWEPTSCWGIPFQDMAISRPPTCSRFCTCISSPPPRKLFQSLRPQELVVVGGGMATLGESMRDWKLSVGLTHAGLNVESVAPGAVISAVDGDLTFTSAGVTPVLPRAEILDGCGIRTRVNSVRSRPVVSAQVIILHRERRLGTVDGWR